MSGKALVTGATGHLGANLVRRLLADGETVRALVRPGDRSAALDGLDVERVVGDLRDSAAITAAVRGCERVYHAGALVSTVEGDGEHKRAIFETNVLGTQHVLEASLRAGVRRVVVTGSFSAVGYDPENPSLPSNEEMPFDPSTRRRLTPRPRPRPSSNAGRPRRGAWWSWPSSHRGRTTSSRPGSAGDVLVRADPVYIPGGFPFVAARDIRRATSCDEARAQRRAVHLRERVSDDGRDHGDVRGRYGRKRPYPPSPAAMSAIAQLVDPSTRWIPPNGNA
jgi:hypothetical protein